MTHVETECRCSVGHLGEPPCIQCRECREWIRPRDMRNECPGPMTKERMEREFLAMGILLEGHTDA